MNKIDKCLNKVNYCLNKIGLWLNKITAQAVDRVSGVRRDIDVQPRWHGVFRAASVAGACRLNTQVAGLNTAPIRCPIGAGIVRPECPVAGGAHGLFNPPPR